MNQLEAQINLTSAIAEQRNQFANECARLQVKLAMVQTEFAEFKAALPAVEPALPPAPVAPSTDPNDYD